MSKPIGTPRNVVAQDRRELFRIEIEVGGADASPTFAVKGHCFTVTRDANGAEIGRAPGYVTVTLPTPLDNQVAQACTRLLNAIDGV